MIRELLRPANMVTSCGMLAGVYSIVLSAGASPNDSTLFFGAAVAILIATVFDGIDGRVARLTGGGTSFGVQLDSLADLVSFGVAPGVLLYKWGLQTMGPAGFVVASAFILSGAYRLARYNTRMELGQERSRTSEGLTITFSGGMVATLVLYHHQAVGEALTVHLPVVGLTLLLAFLMISNIRFPVFKDVADSPIAVALATATLGGIIVSMVFYHVSFVFVVLGTAYVIVGLSGEIFVYGPRRRQDDFLYLGSLDQDDEGLAGGDEELDTLMDDWVHSGQVSGPMRRFWHRVRRRP